MGKERETVKALEQERIKLLRSIIELEFQTNFDRFLKEGDTLLFEGNFVPGLSPFVLDVVKNGERLQMPYGDLDSIFKNIIRGKIDMNPNDYPARAEVWSLGPETGLAANLKPYAGKEVNVKITTFPLIQPRDGILRKIEYVRYFDSKDNALVPLAEVWYGKSMGGTNPHVIYNERKLLTAGAIK